MVTHPKCEESFHKKEEESNEMRVVETPPNLVENVRSLREKLQIFKADNDMLMKEREK